MNSAWKTLLTSNPSELITSGPTWNQVKDKPTKFEPTEHSHVKLDNFPIENIATLTDKNVPFHVLLGEKDQSTLLYDRVYKNTVVWESWFVDNAAASVGVRFDYITGIGGARIPKMVVTWHNSNIDFEVPFVNSNVSYTWRSYQNFTSGAGNSGSDMRFKRNITEIPSLYEFVKNLHIFEYDWIKENEERHTFGIDSSQLEESGISAISSMVHEREDEDKTKWVEYDRFGLIALSVIKELIEKNTELENRLALLEAKFEEISK